MQRALPTYSISGNRFHSIFLKIKKISFYLKKINKSLSFSKLVLTLICAVFFLNVKGQHIASANSYEGIWAGVLENSNESKLAIIVQVSNGIVTR